MRSTTRSTFARALAIKSVAVVLLAACGPAASSSPIVRGTLRVGG